MPLLPNALMEGSSTSNRAVLDAIGRTFSKSLFEFDRAVFAASFPHYFPMPIVSFIGGFHVLKGSREEKVKIY